MFEFKLLFKPIVLKNLFQKLKFLLFLHLLLSLFAKLKYCVKFLEFSVTLAVINISISYRFPATTFLKNLQKQNSKIETKHPKQKFKFKMIKRQHCIITFLSFWRWFHIVFSIFLLNGFRNCTRGVMLVLWNHH